MARLRRKTLVVCRACHDAIHAGQPHRRSRRNHRRARCGESRTRRSGWRPPGKDPPSGHLAGGLPAPCGTTWPKPSNVPSPATAPACKNRHRTPNPAPAAEQAAPAPEGGLAARTRARHAEIHAALARGLTITEISRTLRLERKTVRRYATAATADQLIGGARLTRPGLLGPHQAYLRQRWDEGVRSTERLHPELRDRGYRGSLRTLRRLTAQLRQDTAVPAPPPAPAAKKVASWILTPPADLADDDRAALAQITARCEELNATRDLVRELRGHALPPPRRAPGSLGQPGRGQPGQRAARLQQRTPQATGPPSPPGSPCPTAPAPSKATSTASFCGIRIVKSALPGLGGHRRSGGWWRWLEGRVAGASARPAWGCRRAGPAACRGRRCRRRRRPARPR